LRREHHAFDEVRMIEKLGEGHLYGEVSLRQVQKVEEES
jgi:hypothetical protein